VEPQYRSPSDASPPFAEPSGLAATPVRRSHHSKPAYQKKPSDRTGYCEHNSSPQSLAVGECSQFAASYGVQTLAATELKRLPRFYSDLPNKEKR
jgi:hypothetical protein